MPNPIISGDCARCADQTLCGACYASLNPAADLTLHTALVTCGACNACYNTCGGAGQMCMSGDLDGGTCDVGTPGLAACTSCAQCAVQGPCQSQANACDADSQCLTVADICIGLPL